MYSKIIYKLWLIKRRKKSSHLWVREGGIFEKHLQTLQHKRENREISQQGVFHFRLSESLNVTIWMLDEESPDNNHTCFRQTLVINTIFISPTLKLFRQILRIVAICMTILSKPFEPINRLEQRSFSSLDLRVFASTNKRWKGKLLELTWVS